VVWSTELLPGSWAVGMGLDLKCYNSGNQPAVLEAQLGGKMDQGSVSEAISYWPGRSH
jgi:hypothetical protein